MTQADKVNELFKKTLIESEIQHFFICGFDKYIVCDDMGTLFVVRMNRKTEKYFLIRTKLMMEKYARAKLPFDLMPDCTFLCGITVRRYKLQKRMERDLKPIFSLLGSFYSAFCKKTK